LIKRLLRTSWKDFDMFCWSSLLFSLSYSWTLRVFFEHSWRVWNTWSFLARRKRKSKKVQEGIGINNKNGFCLELLSCMYVFLTSFGMHGTCIWFMGHDLSLTWKIFGLIVHFTSLAISWIAMLLWVYFFVYQLVLMFPLSWVEVIVPGSPGWKNTLESL